MPQFQSPKSRIKYQRLASLVVNDTDPNGNRRPDRSKTRWKDSVDTDLKPLGLSNWITLARNRSDRKHVRGGQ